jgi:hypothetical protein
MQEKYNDYDLTADVKDNNGEWLGCYSVSFRGKRLHIERDIEIRNQSTDIGAQHATMAYAREYADRHSRG